MESFKEYFSSKQLQELRKQSQSLPQFRGPKENGPGASKIEKQQAEIRDMITEHLGVLKEERIIRKGNISTATWDSEHSCAEVTSQKGSYWNYFGKIHHDKLILSAEEALFLVEQGCLELYHSSTPLSVQQTFSILLPCTFSLSHYLVYAYLLRLGYVVVRHQKRPSTDTNESSQISDSKAPCQENCADENDAPLVQPRDASTTGLMLSKLQIIKSHRMDKAVSSSKGLSYNIDFDVYLPGAHFRKSDPGSPAFCISVCRFSDPPPSLVVLNNLTQHCHPVPLKFALTDDGTITIKSLLDVELPVYITNG